jgi:hypothetical protein
MNAKDRISLTHNEIFDLPGRMSEILLSCVHQIPLSIME